MSHYLSTSLRVATSMAQFYSLVRQLKPCVVIDLNHMDSDEQLLVGSYLTEGSSPMCSPPSPWSLGFKWTLDGLDVAACHRSLHLLADDNRLVIHHLDPRVIRISACSFSAQFLGLSELELDSFDAIVRMFRQQDEELYVQFGHRRWRYYFEFDFMCAIMSGSFGSCDANFLFQFNIRKDALSIAYAKMLFFPALVQHQWVVYAWSLEANVIYVFDPCFQSLHTGTRGEIHDRVCYLLKLALRLLCRSTGLFPELNCCDAQVRFFNIPTVPADP